MERILIIGSPCSGKSRLARTMGKKLSLPVVHLDKLWWKRGETALTREEFDTRLDGVLEKDAWIMDGNFQRTLDRRIQKCDAIVYLDFGRWECLMGLFQRFLVRRDRVDWASVKHIWNYPESNREAHYTYLAKATHAKTIVLKNRAQVRAFIQAM